MAQSSDGQKVCNLNNEHKLAMILMIKTFSEAYPNGFIQDLNAPM